MKADDGLFNRLNGFNRLNWLSWRSVLAGIMLAVLSACAAHAAKPDWIDSNPKMFAAEMYLMGRGVGSTANEAQDRARGDLATVFEVRVQVSNEATTTVTQSGKKEQVDKQATQQVSAKTDKVISGITIAEVWRDPVAMDFHALAILSRAQAAASLREELGKIDDSVQAEMTHAKTATDPLLALGALTRAMDTAISRDGFQAALKVVDASGRGRAAPISQTEIRAQIGATLQHIKIAPALDEGASNKEFLTILKGGLAAAGFLAAGEDNADLQLVGKMDMADLGKKDDWHWSRGSIKISLIEKATGRVRGSKTWMIKASAQDVKTARSRLLIEAEKLLKLELRLAIIEFSAS